MSEQTNQNLNHQNDSDMGKGSSSILNDFCLLQILKRLDISDLCNVVNVNKQFKRVASIAFSGRYETFWYPQHLVMHFDDSYYDSYRSQMRRVLCHFGHLIKSLKLKDFDPAGVFMGIRLYPIEMDAISKYCAGTLEELKLQLFLHFDCDLARPLFSSLKKLKMSRSGSYKGDANALFSNCDELKTFKLNGIPYTEFISEIAQKYPNLEELYIGGAATLNAETTFALLQMNPQIKKLDMYDDHANKTIYAVASKMENLEELTLRCRWNQRDYENFNELGKIKSLKSLEIHDMGNEFVSAIAAMESVPIECLKWFDCPSNLEFTGTISKLKSLKSLALTTISSPFDDCLVKFGDQLNLLEALELGFKHQEKPLFSTECLVKFVERSPNLSSIVIHTIHSEMFGQQFYNSLLQVVSSRSTSKKLQMRVYGKVAASLQEECEFLKVELLEGQYCTCSHCEPVNDWELEYDFNDDFDDDFDVDDYL